MALTFTSKESFFAFMKGKKFLHQEEWVIDENTKMVKTVFTNDPQQAYTLRNKDRAQFHLDEYANRLKGFRIVEIKETFTRSYKVV